MTAALHREQRADLLGHLGAAIGVYFHRAPESVQ